MPLSLDPDEARRYAEAAEPGSFLDLVSAAAYRAAVAGVRLGVFAALKDGALTVAELAAATKADERGTRLLCDLLAHSGYLTEESDDRYANTAQSATWLADGEDGYALVELFWQRVVFELWTDLEESVRSGAPAVDFYAWLGERPDVGRQFQTMLGGHAAAIAPSLADAVPVPDGAASLLDVGGGHARYAVALAERHPELRATVLDLAAALEVGAENVAAAGLGDRVTLVPGDLTTDDLGEATHDVVLLFNVVHGRDAAANRALLARVHAAVKPGGAIVVLEHDLTPPPGAGATAAAFLRVFGLNLFHGENGQVYALAETTAMLREAGFDEPSAERLSSSPMQHVIVARRPA